MRPLYTNRLSRAEEELSSYAGEPEKDLRILFENIYNFFMFFLPIWEDIFLCRLYSPGLIWKNPFCFFPP